MKDSKFLSEGSRVTKKLNLSIISLNLNFRKLWRHFEKSCFNLLSRGTGSGLEKIKVEKFLLRILFDWRTLSIDKQLEKNLDREIFIHLTVVNQNIFFQNLNNLEKNEIVHLNLNCNDFHKNISFLVF